MAQRVFESAAAEFAAVCDVLKTPLGDESPHAPLNTLPAYIHTQANAVKAVNYETMKLLVHMSEPPYSKESIEKLVKEITNAVMALSNNTRKYSKHYGGVLYSVQQQHSVTLLRALHSLFLALAEHIRSPSDKYLRSAGKVMEATEAYPSLPTSNGAATVAALQATYGLLNDAKEELEQSMDEIGEEEGESEESEEESEKTQRKMQPAMLDPLCKILTASGKLISKTCTLMEEPSLYASEAGIPHQDALAAAVRPLSELCDEVVLTTYSTPFAVAQLKQAVDAFIQKNRDVLVQIRACLPLTGVTDETGDRKWVRFLEQALDHNLGKLAPFLQ